MSVLKFIGVVRTLDPYLCYPRETGDNSLGLTEDKHTVCYTRFRRVVKMADQSFIAAAHLKGVTCGCRRSNVHRQI